MKLLMITTLITLMSTVSFAGSAQKEFSFESASGRTLVQGDVPGDAIEHNVTFAIDGYSLNYLDQYVWNSSISDSQRKQNSNVYADGVLKGAKPNFHFVITDMSGEAKFTFIALPGTINVRKTGNGEAGSFAALVVGADPRPGKRLSPTIRVQCSYSYEI